MRRLETRHESSAKTLTWLSLTCLLFCGSAPAALGAYETSDDLESLLRSRGLIPDRVIRPFTLTDEMRQWARDAVPRRFPAEKKLELLTDALLSPDRLNLEYSRLHTGTAREVFEERRANCLAFTNLFVGMARELGVPVYFLEVDTEIYRKEGDLVVLANHIAVGYGTGPQIRMYDFSENRNDEYRDVRRIPDYTAVAMFYSNRGAELLQRPGPQQQDRQAEATGWLRTAVAIDPELASAWGNLGVALRRIGDLDGAERAYRRAIEVDPRIYSSYANLSALLRLQSRDDEARRLELLLAKSPSRNPYTYLALGDLSFQSNRLTEARRFYRRAIHLSRGEAEPYAALAEVAVATGDLRTARKMLRKARKLGLENQRTLRLAEMIVPNER